MEYINCLPFRLRIGDQEWPAAHQNDSAWLFEPRPVFDQSSSNGLPIHMQGISSAPQAMPLPKDGVGYIVTKHMAALFRLRGDVYYPYGSQMRDQDNCIADGLVRYMMPSKPVPIGTYNGMKWVRFFRLQMAVKQTAKNRHRLADGLKQVGRPTPRLVSLDFEDAMQAPKTWTAADAINYAANESIIPYFAVFIDGAYHVVPSKSGEIDPKWAQACLDAGKIMVLPWEALSKW